MPSYLHNLLNDRCTSYVIVTTVIKSTDHRQCNYGHHVNRSSSMSLRSSRQPLPEIHRCRTDLGRRAFSVAAAENWNKLPLDIKLGYLIPVQFFENA